MLCEGKREIESALRWQGLSLSLKIEQIEEKTDPADEDIAKLTSSLGDYLKIYGGE